MTSDDIKEAEKQQEGKQIFGVIQILILKLNLKGCGGGNVLVVSVLAMNTDDLSSNPAEILVLCWNVWIERK